MEFEFCLLLFSFEDFEDFEFSLSLFGFSDTILSVFDFCNCIDVRQKQAFGLGKSTKRNLLFVGIRIGFLFSKFLFDQPNQNVSSSLQFKRCPRFEEPIKTESP
jgi:hypothetical protein